LDDLSELELMRSGAVAKSESGAKVALEVLDLLDVGNEGSIHGLLHALGLSFPLSLALLGSLNLFLSDLGGVLELVLGVSSGSLEEGVVNVDVDAVKGNLGAGGDDVSGVHSS
jgi:hypothetical protein